MNTITITRRDYGYILSVDGGSIECATLGAALDIVRRETGDTASSAKWEALEAAQAELDAMTADRDKYKDWWFKAYTENGRLKEAICKAFVKEFGK